MKKSILKIVSAILTIALCICVVGCTAAPAASPIPSPDTSTPESERTVTVTDMSGDTVTVTGEVTRIINLWPSGTSSFYVMGAGDLLVGQANSGTISAWTKLFYPEAANIPSLGSTTPSIEDIIKLDPDLVIIHPSSAADGFAQKIRDVGVPAVNINFNNYDTMMTAYTSLGEILGGEYQKKLATWCTAVENKLANARKLTADIKEEDRPIVFYIAGQSDSLTTTLSATSIVGDWVSSAGGQYAPKLMNLTSTETTPEAIFAVNPDVFICGGVFQHVEKNALETTAGWKDLKAVKTGRVYTNPYACFNWERFGLESQMQINYALMCIQPEIAQANGINKDSMLKEVVDFYKTYTNFDLTNQQAEYMLAGLSPDGTAENSVE